MEIIKGKSASAYVYSDTAEAFSLAQVKMICNNKAASGSKIRLMPDIHPGKIGPIGLTMTVRQRVLPGLVGIDIGCGVSYAKFKAKHIEYQKLDRIIGEEIPAGMSIRREALHVALDFDFGKLRCFSSVDQNRARCSLGTLGGGNHFIEVDRDQNGFCYVVVHSGSRYLGKAVSEQYMRFGQKAIKAKGEDVPYEMTYLEGQLMEDYLHDLQIVQEYAELNRQLILNRLCKGMKWKVLEYGNCHHNYIDENRVLRKGAIAAYTGQPVIIPINGKDGIILGIGKGNSKWNFSAPHGAGRVMNRTKVGETFTVSQYKKVMEGIYSSSIGRETLDEAPFAYRGLEEILSVIGETVEVREVLKPLYNYKAGNRG